MLDSDYSLPTVSVSSAQSCGDLITVNTCIVDICISWRKVIRRIWSLPYKTHSHLLPLLCNCLAINDQLCDRFLNFVRRCLSEHSSKLVRTITFHGLMFSRSHSPIGHNFMYCMKRYCFNYIDFLHSEYSIARHCSSLVEPADVLNANFLKELICLRNRTLTFSEHKFLSSSGFTCKLEQVASS